VKYAAELCRNDVEGHKGADSRTTSTSDEAARPTASDRPTGSGGCEAISDGRGQVAESPLRALPEEPRALGALAPLPSGSSPQQACERIGLLKTVASDRDQVEEPHQWQLVCHPALRTGRETR